MIVKDYQPFSIVEDEGFINLLKILAPKYKIPNRKLITKIVDEKYSKVVKSVQKKIEDKDLTITADIWTDSHTTKSYLGVTCHFLNLQISTNLEAIDLGVYILSERHSSAYISSCFEEILKQWAIPKEQVCMIVTDHASNMLKSVAETFSEEKHIGCVSHAINLVAKKSIDSTKALPALVDKVKRIVAFFRRSTIATDKLHKLQLEDDPNKTPLKITSFVPTRWNSEYKMIKRFLELYKYIQTIMADQDRSTEMVKTDEKRNLEDIVKILQPLNEVTEDLSGDNYATVSRVLPIINCLQNFITAIQPLSSIGKSLQASLLREIQSRFDDYRVSAVYGPSMLLDPRFKDVHFKSTDERNAAIQIITHMVLPTTDESDDDEFLAEEPPNKIPSDNGVWSYHEGMVQRHNNRKISMRSPDSVRKEMEMYLKNGIEPMTCDIFRYWEDKKSTFPFLYKPALKLLSRIATSVPSERLFSKTGRILSEARSSLDPERVNRIIFLHNVDVSIFKTV